MPLSIESFAAIAAAIMEVVGIGIIVFLGFIAVFSGIQHWIRNRDENAAYFHLRQRLGRGILLGLEFLVAADIIYTVSIELTF